MCLLFLFLATFIICGCKHRYPLNHPPDPLSMCAHRAQKRALYCMPCGCELPYGYMGSDQGPLEEQPLLDNSWASSPDCVLVFWDKVLNLQWSSCHASGLHHHCWFICLSLFLRCYQAASNIQRGLTTAVSWFHLFKPLVIYSSGWEWWFTCLWSQQRQEDLLDLRDCSTLNVALQPWL